MRSLIYYPGFEPTDATWLKFALLYLDDVQPIVPESADSQLTDDFREVQRESDLITLYRPTYEQGVRATNDAIEQAERILEQPETYSRVLKFENVEKHWRNLEKGTVELWGEKFEYGWQEFCLQRKMAKKTPRGIIIAKTLANIYMTILANCIADSSGISPITDQGTLSEYALFARQRGPSQLDKEVTILKTELPVMLPKNLTEIPIERILQLRAKADFAKKRRAMQDVTRKVAESLEAGEDSELKDELGSLFRDFWAEIGLLGLGVANYGYGVWLAASDPTFGTAKALQHVLAGTLLSASGVAKLASTWGSTKTKRLARSYVLDLANLRAD